MLLPLLWMVVAMVPPAAPDTLVVCPAEFRVALAPWKSYRSEQGHVIAVIDPPASANELRDRIVRAARSGRLKYVVLVGDAPDMNWEQGAGTEETRATQGRSLPDARSLPTVPTNYVEARVNIHWGSEPTIATDQPYADVDGDGLPDLAVGRIPVDTPDELAANVRKLLRYEQQAEHGLWRRRVNVVAGVGGFGRVTDALVEAAARSVIERFVPQSFEVGQTIANPSSPFCPPPGQFTAELCHQLSDGCFIWMYLGHGLPTALDAIATPDGMRPMMCVEDVAKLKCGPNNPLAVLVACYTGAFDASEDCLGEMLATSERGPVAVVAATRVTMPYGNAVLGCELLRACFTNRPTTIGDLWTSAQRRAILPASGDPLRVALDAMACGVSPPPVDLDAERREHVMLYQLLGDPLMRLEYPADIGLEAVVEADGRELSIQGSSQVSGQCHFELVPIDSDTPVQRSDATTITREVAAGAFQCTIPLPPNAAGRYLVRAFVASKEIFAIGVTTVDVKRQANRIARVPESGRRK